MRISIRSKILGGTIIFIIIFLLISRVILVSTISGNYEAVRIENLHRNISTKLNGLKKEDENKLIEELKKSDDAIKSIKSISNDEFKSIERKETLSFSDVEYIILNSLTKNNEGELICRLVNGKINLHVIYKNSDAVIIAAETAFKFVAIFLIIFAFIFAFFINIIITGKARKLNIISKEICEGNFLGVIEKDIIEDEFDDLIDNINHISKDFERNIKELNREKLYKKQLMLSLSHEIKTPIGGLNGILEGMLDEIHPYTDRDKYIRECRKLSSRLEQIASEMLDITKMDSLITDREEVGIRVILEEILDGLNALVICKNLRIINEIDYRVTLITDKRLLKRSLINIIENAIKYSNNRGVIRLKSKGYQISVYNECDGLTSDDLEFVFNPLYRGTNKKSVNGRGIGLYIVKECLTALNIKYDIDNYKDGVVFRIDLKGDEEWI